MPCASLPHAQVGQLAGALVKATCPQNESLLIDFKRAPSEPWAVRRKFAVYIVHEEKVAEVEQMAEAAKAWLVGHTELEAAQIALQVDQQNTWDRAIDDVTNEDLAPMREQVDCVLLLQSANVLKQPRCLARLYATATAGVPLCCVVLNKTKAEHAPLLYDFEAAKPWLEDLPNNLSADTATELGSACGQPTGDVGRTLSELLPNIISKVPD